ILLCGGALAHAQTTKILFIGNSYTAYNNLPSLVKNVAWSAGDTFLVQSHTPGGSRFLSHAGNPQVYDLIRSENWDYVVLQGQSQEPSWPDGQVASDVFPYAKQLCDSIRSINSCTVPLFYMTWGRKNGDAQNCANWPPVCTYKGMDSILYSNYQKMGDNNGGEVSPVGAVWNYLRLNSPALELYSADQSHPSLKGSIAAAFTFYSAISRKDPSLITYSTSISAVERDSIISAVNAVFYRNQSTYNSGINDANSAFSVEKEGCEFSVEGLPSNETYRWNFGDGATSTTQNASHSYSQSGNYTIRLIVTKCSLSDTTEVKVSCGLGRIKAQGEDDVLVYPNPNRGVFYISSEYTLVSVTNLSGQKLKTLQLGNSSFQVEDNADGIVFVELENNLGLRVVQKITLE
ncbi:MAG: PKD domain-containing protein, partial [Bacteroidia bacterium]|nr:PKD domain-containing protein [Bacteroidia bacterium]